MKTVFLVIASLLTICSVIPYIRDILKGSTKPNLVSWITWTLITGIATAAEIAGHQYVTAVVTGSATVATISVVSTGLIKGSVKYGRFDISCQFAAIIGLILWQVFNSPTIGVIFSVAIDFTGVLPTIRHAWKKPFEETLTAFTISSIGSAFGLLALRHFNVISMTYPIYIVSMNLLITFVILKSRRVHILR